MNNIIPPFEYKSVKLEKLKYAVQQAIPNSFKFEMYQNKILDAMMYERSTEILAEKRIDHIDVKFSYVEYNTWLDHLIDTIGMKQWLPGFIRRWCSDHSHVTVIDKTKTIRLKQYILHPEIPTDRYGGYDGLIYKVKCELLD